MQAERELYEKCGDGDDEEGLRMKYHKYDQDQP